MVASTPATSSGVIALWKAMTPVPHRHRRDEERMDQRTSHSVTHSGEKRRGEQRSGQGGGWSAAACHR